MANGAWGTYSPPLSTIEARPRRSPSSFSSRHLRQIASTSGGVAGCAANAARLYASRAGAARAGTNALRHLYRSLKMSVQVNVSCIAVRVLP
jgi:hypothetical protein